MDSSKLEGCQVLLAEDYPDIQRPVSYVLEKAGAHVTVAENGQRAIELALAADRGREPFHVILMDMQMPLVDGYTATRRLREIGHDGPILAITAHAMDVDRQKCLAVGCDDYIAKPIDMQRLIELIHGYSSLRSNPGTENLQERPDTACVESRS